MAAVNINKEEFGQLRGGDLPVLVDFWAPWCGYCRRIGPAYEQIAEESAGRLVAAKVNIDDEGALASAEGIEVIPTLVLYRGGKALSSVVAPASKAAIDKFIRETLGQ